MEDFPLLILFFIFYLIAGSSKKKKKNRRQTRGRANPGPMRTRVQGEQADMRAAARDRQTLEGFANAFGVPADHQECDAQPIHLHEVSQAQMSMAAEGEDPCHAGGSEEAHRQEDILTDDEEHQLRQDVLRGVIMSEILTRPCDRMAMRRDRQRRYGH